MSVLRVGYDLFAGSSQAGTDGGVGGNFQVETAKALPHYVKIKRTADSYYWNNTSQAYQTSTVAQADEYLIPGSDGHPQAIRRLLFKLPEAACTSIASTGVTLTVYAQGDTPSSAGCDIVLEFTP